MSASPPRFGSSLALLYRAHVMRREFSLGHCWEVLRITIADTPAQQRWVLAGRLTAPCIAQLQDAWKQASAARQGRSCLVDLRDVTFIDQNGERALRKMMQEGAQFLCRGIYTTQVVEEMEKRHRRASGQQPATEGKAGSEH